jgi:thioredoxin 1
MSKTREIRNEDRSAGRFSALGFAIRWSILVGVPLFIGCAQHHPIEEVEDYVIQLKSDSEFDELLDNNKIVVVDFFADWCAPCRILKPIINEVAKQYETRVTVVSVDIDKFKSIAGRFNITSIPTIKIFNSGKIEQTLVGVQPKENYTKAIGMLTGT